jgi:hypothetical protein
MSAAAAFSRPPVRPTIGSHADILQQIYFIDPREAEALKVMAQMVLDRLRASELALIRAHIKG